MNSLSKKQILIAAQVVVTTTIGVLTLSFGGTSFADTRYDITLKKQVANLEENNEKFNAQSSLGVQMFYDPVKDVAGSVTGEVYTNGDKAWVEIGLIIYDIYRQLGGEKLKKKIFFQNKNNLFLASIQNVKTNWHSNRDQALLNFFFSLLNNSTVISSSLVSPNHLERITKKQFKLKSILEKLISNSPLPTKLRVGEALELKFPQSEIAIAGPALNVKQSTKFKNGVTARVSTNSQSIPSLQLVYGFSSNQKFRPKSYKELTLTDLPTSADQFEETKSTSSFVKSTLLNGMISSIDTSGEIKRYDLHLNSQTQFQLSSKGPSDLIGTILDKTGAIIHTDDDSGKGYNFALNQKLKAGDYFVEIRHCCAGTGSFKLKMQTSNFD
jgi:hypothetical protein